MTSTTQQNYKSQTQMEDDESDSSFLFKKRQAIKIENDENDDNYKSTTVLNTQISPPIIVQKTTTSKIINVKPVSLIQNVRTHSPNKNRIDKIADNLKIKQQQKTNQIPKVAPIPLNRDSLIKKYQLNLLNNLNNKQNEINYSDDENDHQITNLNWLCNFNLTSIGLTPLSPPQSPPSISAPSIQRLKIPIINPCVRKLNDESDGCHSIKSNTQSNLLKILKSFVPITKQNQPVSKPHYSFSSLIFLAIESSNHKRLSVKEIYSWICQNFPYYRNVPSGSWKNSIRHNLSTNQTFTKVDKNLLTMRDFSGKGSLWCVNPEFRHTILDILIKNKRLDSLPYLEDISEIPKVVTNNNFNSMNKTHERSSSSNTRSSRISNFSKPAIVNPKLTNVCKKFDANLSTNDNCTELDAVNALLTMKSRASSMPHSKLDSTANDLPKKGRRKQLFKPPTKKRPNDESDECSDEFEDNLNIENSDEDQFDSDTLKNKNNKKKLFVKFQYFKPNKQVQNEESDEDEEETLLKIDESSHSDNDSISKRKSDEESDENVNKKQKLTNPLLELSRAASLIEDQN